MNSDYFILVADDNFDNLKIIGNILKSEGYKVALATNGTEVFEIVDQNLPVLILLDIMMPEMDGYETCQKLKEKKATKDIPVIFLTAKNQVEDIVKGFHAGGVDYVTKPFSKEELIARVNTHVELKQSKDIIVTQANKLKKANDAKNKLFSIISHDMKTPLVTLKMLLDNLIDIDIQGHERFVKESFKIMQESAQQAYQLFDNLLIWSRGQLGMLKTSPVYFDLNQVIVKNIDLYENATLLKKIKIEYNNSGETLAYADEDMISTIIRNLLGNAIKFSHQGTTIRIEKANNTKFIEVSFTDEGIGIAKSKLDSFFETNTMVTTVGTSGEKGTGVGLGICRAFTEMNAGKLNIDSTLEKGTKVSFTIPVKKI